MPLERLSPARRRRWRNPVGDSGCESATGEPSSPPAANPPDPAHTVPPTRRSLDGAWGNLFSSRLVPSAAEGKGFLPQVRSPQSEVTLRVAGEFDFRRLEGIIMALRGWAGCGAVWLARVPWEHEVGGSNPPTPTRPTVVVVAQLVRAPDCGSGGRGFESPQPPQRRAVSARGLRRPFCVLDLPSDATRYDCSGARRRRGVAARRGGPGVRRQRDRGGSDGARLRGHPPRAGQRRGRRRGAPGHGGRLRAIARRGRPVPGPFGHQAQTPIKHAAACCRARAGAWPG